ncbi:unnamed protein product, partial [Ascophyllum nodosum]
MALSSPPVACMVTPRPATKGGLFGRERQSMYRALITRRISARTLRDEEQD